MLYRQIWTEFVGPYGSLKYGALAVVGRRIWDVWSGLSYRFYHADGTFCDATDTARPAPGPKNDD